LNQALNPFNAALVRITVADTENRRQTERFRDDRLLLLASGDLDYRSKHGVWAELFAAAIDEAMQDPESIPAWRLRT
jgi:hypothetical protein